MSRADAAAKPWVARDYIKCTGCRLCEIACTLKHEGRIWPEASRVRVFMLVPGVEVPHLCTQCTTYPCIAACPTEALSANEDTGAVLVDNEKCTACGLCIDACPGKIPHLHPDRTRIVICDLCGGDPECTKICERARYFALFRSTRPRDSVHHDLYAKNPEEITANLIINLYGEKGKEFI